MPSKRIFIGCHPSQTKGLKDGETYTFELTALGTSSSTTKVLTSAATSAMVQIGTGAVVDEEDEEGEGSGADADTP